MTDRDRDPLNGVRPGGRRSFWLREALAGAPAALAADVAAPPFAGRGRADVAIGDGATPRAFPPEPFRALGGRVFRDATARRERIEEAGGTPPAVIREISKLPRRLGYHLGPE